VWYVASSHDPFLKLDDIGADADHAARSSAPLVMDLDPAHDVPGLPLTDSVVTFSGGGLSAGKTTIDAQAKPLLPSLSLISPDGVLRADLTSLKAIHSVHRPLVCRVQLPGGRLTPQFPKTPGGQKRWSFTDQLSLQLCEDILHDSHLSDASPVFVTVTPKDGRAITYPVKKDALGNYNLRFAACHRVEKGAARPRNGALERSVVVFLDEFAAFGHLLDPPDEVMPFTYWPDFDSESAKETDPNGGGCSILRLRCGD
jgi:hypothetical protein